MYYDTQMNNGGLSLSELLSATKRPMETNTGFPYTKEVCKCRFCLYCKQGKCVLQSCCCLPERIRAHACSFTEVMNECFHNVKDNLFRFRLRIAMERASELHTCFLDREHHQRFYEGLNLSRRKDNSFAAQTFLLSSTKRMWERASDCLHRNGYSYDDIDLYEFSLMETNLFYAALDMEHDYSHYDIEDLCSDEIVDFDVFRAICYAVCIHAYGGEVVAIATKRKRTRKKKKGRIANDDRE